MRKVKKYIERFRSTVWCEDIRHEINNKLMLIGVFAGDIAIMSVPATLVVSVYLECLLRVNESEIIFTYFLANDRIAEVKAKLTEQQEGLWGPIILPPVPLAILHPGELRLEASIDGSPPETIGSKLISLASPST